MAVTGTPYNHLMLCLLNGAMVLASDTLKLMLVSSAYTPDAEHTQIADVSAHEITGTNYTAGGQALTGVAASRSGASAKLDAADLTFAALTATFRYGVLYADVTRGGLTGPLVGYFVLDSADVVVSGVDYPVVWDAAGIIPLTRKD